MVNGEGKKFSSAIDAIQSSYADAVTDEFILPCVITEEGNAITKIAEGDAVLCFNFRTDRCREITLALTQTDMHEQNMHKLNLHYVTMTRYDESFKGINVMYEKDNLNKTLGEVLSENGLQQLRMAETEKYPHVTFFFNGGRESAFDNEDRIMEPSPKVATYDLQPEMSAVPLKNAFLNAIEKKDYNFVCLNFANPDMVGHTGVYDAVKKAVETVDACVAEMVTKAVERGYSFIIIADHGNSEYMINEDGSPNTAHTTNPVPFIVIDRDVQAVKNGILADVAPTILNLLNIVQPNEMTGKSLVAL
jgi:2,3-bisphosphoglycerate-independent phosphoglycerate mutase